MKRKGVVLKMGAKNVFLSVVCMALAALLLFCRGEAAIGAGEGLRLCGGVVIPALFPFMFLVDFIAEARISRAIGRALSPLFYRLFGFRGAAASAILLSFLGGYPVSARMASALFESGDISRQEAKSMLRFCVNSGPAFCISALGGGMLGSIKAGIVIFLSAASASIIAGILLKPRGKAIFAKAPIRCNQVSVGEAFCNAVASSSWSVFSICGYTILFSVFIAIARRFLPLAYLRPVLPLLEITSGLSLLGRCPIWLYAAYISFGGFSVQFQLLRFSKPLGISFWEIFKWRVVCSGLSAAICFLALQFFPVSLPEAMASAPAFRSGQGNIAASFCLFFSAFVALGFLGQTFQKKNQII